MVWSLNNDYYPSAWGGDTYAAVGAFSNIIFGAPPAQQGPVPTPEQDDVYFILQLSNTGSNNFASTTLIVGSNYYPFGSQAGTPIAPGATQMWGTLASSKNIQGVVDSWNLDQMFKDEANSITANIVINSYISGSQNIDSPTKQANAGSYTFNKGHSYNIMVNPDTMAYDIKEVS